MCAVEGGWYKCASSSGFFDSTSNTPQTVWPSGPVSPSGSCRTPCLHMSSIEGRLTPSTSSILPSVFIRLSMTVFPRPSNTHRPFTLRWIALPGGFCSTGTCCNGGGACSDPALNDDRYVIEFAYAKTHPDYDVRLQIPAGLAPAATL